jgi:hypothetical protein
MDGGFFVKIVTLENQTVVSRRFVINMYWNDDSICLAWFCKLARKGKRTFLQFAGPKMASSAIFFFFKS